jgi:hypothetical protein
VKMHSPASHPNSPHQLAAQFLERYNTGGLFLRANIDQLITLATGGDESQASAATTAIFESLVEPLSDSFEPDSVGLYIRIMAQIIHSSRKLDSKFDDQLTSFGLASEQDLIDRAGRHRPAGRYQAPGDLPRSIQAPNTIKRIIILSRVTIGADVAITSVIIERLKHRFPQATLTLVGGAKSSEIFGANPRLDFADLEYGRRATLMGRLSAWLDLVSLVKRVTAGLNPAEFLIVDPDSRLTQLGILPVAPDSNYLFFPSREYMSCSAEPLARLASDWSGQLLALDRVQLPRLAIGALHLSFARDLVESIRGDRSHPVVSVNFGVGNNDKKRVGPDFEAAILNFLLDHDALVILDRGAGPSESSDTDSLIAGLDLSRHGLVAVAGGPDLKAPGHGGSPCPDLLVCSGGVGLLAALIAASDLYIGYDSAGQHIAAAAGTPCIEIFSGYTGRRMIDRWRPTGSASVIVVDAGPGSTVDQITEEAKAGILESLKATHLES